MAHSGIHHSVASSVAQASTAAARPTMAMVNGHCRHLVHCNFVLDIYARLAACARLLASWPKTTHACTHDCGHCGSPRAMNPVFNIYIMHTIIG